MSDTKIDPIPYVLAIVVSALGWQLTNISSEISKTLSLSYNVEVNKSKNIATLHLKNISKGKSVKSLEFSLVCRETSDCFRNVGSNNDQEYAELIAVPPVGTSATEMKVNSNSTISFKTSLPAGGSVKILTNLVDYENDILFYYTPSEEIPDNISLFGNQSLMAILTENYIKFLVSSFFVMSVCFIFWILHAFWNLRYRRSEDDKTVHRVVVSFGSDQ